MSIQAKKRSRSRERTGLMANTEGKMPLYFCAMHGEVPCSAVLIAAAAPEAASMRHASGSTPVLVMDSIR